MKRLILLILLVGLAAWFMIRSEHPRRRPRHDGQTLEAVGGPRAADSLGQEARRVALEARREARQARQALADARVQVREAIEDATREVRQSLREAQRELRERHDDIPVPIVPGTRVEEAIPEPPDLPDLPSRPLAEVPPEPPVPPQPPRPPVPPRPPAPRETRVVSGPISTTAERAREAAREKLDGVVAEWLEAAGVPPSWTPSRQQVDRMIVETTVETVAKDDDALFKDYSTLFVANLRVDVSPECRGGFVRAYRRQLVHGRMLLLGAALAFVLFCLGSLNGYIRADEATRGYYTNRLRLVTAVGVAAAGAVLYRMIA